jgi:short-subunit dehydrogenase
MRLRLKPLSEQVLVITGASSGIGRTAARLAAAKGARVVLAARDRHALDDAVAECEAAGRKRGGEAVAVRCDVSRERDVERLAREAARAFGGVDTWVNNAGTSIYGRLDRVPVEDLRRLMDVNFWGVVYGSRAAVPLLAEGVGGALVNVGSVLSERAIPLQGMYCATKHAVKGFTDALRMEVEEADLPVSVSLVKPASIATPFYDVARNYMDRRPRPVPPVYAPEVAARAILACATRPTRELYAGGAAKALAASEKLAPRLTDKAMERTLFGMQRSDEPPADARGSLDDALDHSSERGRWAERGHVAEHSAYTAATSRGAGPLIAGLVAAGLGVALAARLRAGGGADPVAGALDAPELDVDDVV